MHVNATTFLRECLWQYTVHLATADHTNQTQNQAATSTHTYTHKLGRHSTDAAHSAGGRMQRRPLQIQQARPQRAPGGTLLTQPPQHNNSFSEVSETEGMCLTPSLRTLNQAAKRKEREARPHRQALSHSNAPLRWWWGVTDAPAATTHTQLKGLMSPVRLHCSRAASTHRPWDTFRCQHKCRLWPPAAS